MTDWSGESPSVGLLRLLKEGHCYVVPAHQREYSWTVDEIDRMFADVEQAISEKNDEYFLGLMVFKPEDRDSLIILDGQQRLATATIILAAIREWLRSRGFQTDADQLQGDFIAKRKLGGTTTDPRIVLNRLNNSTFERYVIGEVPDEEIEADLKTLKKHDLNRKLLEAVMHCRTKVRNIANSVKKDQAPQTLFSFTQYLEESVKVVRLVVPNEANAYTVFETLNDRGLDLTALDLVKNYMFGKAEGKSSLPGLQTQWLQMMSNLSNVRADDFLKAWWTSRHGRIQTSQLFNQFRESVRLASDVSKVANDMLRASEQYAALEVVDDPLWVEYSDKARGHLRALKVFGGAQTHPVILAALAKWNKNEIERLLRFLEVLIVRYQLIGGGRTGRLEIGCANLAEAIYSGSSTNTKKSISFISDLLPSDREFKTKFETAEEKGASKTKLLFSLLESQARSTFNKSQLGSELEPKLSLTVEHILPKNPGTDWNEIIKLYPSFCEEYTYRLGNICLLTGINRRIGNVRFEEKKKAYAKSELVLTKEISKVEKWTPQVVEDRQKILAKLAVALWRYSL